MFGQGFSTRPPPSFFPISLAKIQSPQHIATYTIIDLVEPRCKEFFLSMDDSFECPQVHSFVPTHKIQMQSSTCFMSLSDMCTQKYRFQLLQHIAPPRLLIDYLYTFIRFRAFRGDFQQAVYLSFVFFFLVFLTSIRSFHRQRAKSSFISFLSFVHFIHPLIP